MKFYTDYKIEEFALDSKWEDFPEHIRTQAEMCATDLLGALILGSRGKQFKIGETIARSLGLSGDIKVIGSPFGFNLLGASIALGHSSNSFDIDDGHRLIQGHPGTSFIGGVISQAYESDLSVKEFLETLVVCYELTIRWAMAMQKEYNYLHSTGAYGSFGTALGIGRILKLSKTQLNNALSAADYHAPMTPVMRAVEYPSMNKDGVPFGALAGAMAVIETLHGTTAKTHLLEKEEFKFLVDDLGEKYHILDLYFKPYTCCRWAHQPVKAIIDLKNDHGFNYQDIEYVEIKTFRSAALLSKKIPEDTEEAQYNISFPVASALVYGDVGYPQMNDRAVGSKEVLETMKKLTFSVSQDFEKEFPAKRLASVTIKLTNGDILESGVYDAPGEPDDPTLNKDWIVNKFRRITAPVLSESGQAVVIDYIENKNLKIRDLVDKLNLELKIYG